MKISEVIEVLQKALVDHGNVELHYRGNDGYESWIGAYRPKICRHRWPRRENELFYAFEQDGY